MPHRHGLRGPCDFGRERQHIGSAHRRRPYLRAVAHRHRSGGRLPNWGQATQTCRHAGNGAFDGGHVALRCPRGRRRHPPALAGDAAIAATPWRQRDAVGRRGVFASFDPGGSGEDAWTTVLADIADALALLPFCLLLHLSGNACLRRCSVAWISCAGGQRGAQPLMSREQRPGVRRGCCRRHRRMRAGGGLVRALRLLVRAPLLPCLLEFAEDVGQFHALVIHLLERPLHVLPWCEASPRRDVAWARLPRR
mmetsp:Transcript_97493/g.275782  ORF Transcript_97493/g.275782 Transcript_97493/m.275782 type:complete len:252 (-) Transcript_97493:580-1335(-)